MDNRKPEAQVPLAAPTGSDARPTENQVRECLGCEKTSLESLKADGYTLDNNGYGYFFRWKGGVYLQSIPAWVRELLNDTRRSADETARREMREALGITDKHQNK